MLGLAFLRPFGRFAPLALRLGLGIVMAAHGWQKFNGSEGVAGFFGSLGIPAAGVMAWIVIVVELVGGICIILGALTRLWGLLFAFTMLVALFTAKAGAGVLGAAGKPGMELELLLMFCALSIALSGAGALSVDQKLGLNRDDV